MSISRSEGDFFPVWKRAILFPFHFIKLINLSLTQLSQFARENLPEGFDVFFKLQNIVRLLFSPGNVLNISYETLNISPLKMQKYF